MTIKIENFLLILKDGRFDLVESKGMKTNDKGKEYESFKNIGYDMKLVSAVEKIANLLIQRNEPETVVSLREYINMYKREMERILGIINQ